MFSKIEQQNDQAMMSLALKLRSKLRLKQGCHVVGISIKSIQLLKKSRLFESLEQFGLVVTVLATVRKYLDTASKRKGSS
jgi:hypothetical protein